MCERVRAHNAAPNQGVERDKTGFRASRKNRHEPPILQEMLFDRGAERLEPRSPRDSDAKFAVVPTANDPPVAPTKRALKPSRVSALKPAMKAQAARSQQHMQSLFARDAHCEPPHAATASSRETGSNGSEPTSGLWDPGFRAASSGGVAPCVTAMGMAPPPPLLLSSDSFERPRPRPRPSQEAAETMARGAEKLRREVR